MQFYQMGFVIAMKKQLEKDVDATIRLLRFLTYGEGSVYLSVFDSGSFEQGMVSAFLERSGLTIQNRKFYSTEEFKAFLLKMANPFHFSEEELHERYNKKAKESESKK